MEAWQGEELNKAKEILAFELTSLVHGKEEAQIAQNSAKALFTKGTDDENMPSTKISLTGDKIALFDILVECKLASSKGEAKRLIQQGGISVNEEKITSFDYKISKEELSKGVEIKKGKKIFHKAFV